MDNSAFHVRCATALVFVSALALSVEARAGDPEQEFLKDASLEQLDEAGYLIHGIEDVDAIALNAYYLTDQKVSQLERLVDVLASAGLLEDLAAIEQLRDLVEMLSLYAIEDFMPAATGQIDESGWPSTAWEVEGAPDGDFSPTFPKPGDLAGSNWTRTHTDPDGREYWERDGVGEDGSLIHKEMVVDGERVVQTTWQITFENGSGYRSHSEVDANGGEHIVNEKFDENHQPTQRQHVYIAPDAEAPPDPDADGYQPADGSSGVFCPLSLWQCREAAKELSETDPYRIIEGYALFQPAPDGKADPDGPRLTLDPQTLVVNPEAIQNQGKEPTAFRLEIPVIVLPPKPNS
ncbi:hypothetical protein [Enhygromyxa salina]|uniref:Uncharacterized protein n=1 Tax=Enhygromyxa salina TaxID=215803 RepID=A0A2S9XLH3_9BACT|nr:hypothetical protein [Enhygromyxa salina]PRP93580.1 hypothetical protein ENSA7_80080 [Enhygromyxa salina]